MLNQQVWRYSQYFQFLCQQGKEFRRNHFFKRDIRVGSIYYKVFILIILYYFLSFSYDRGLSLFQLFPLRSQLISSSLFSPMFYLFSFIFYFFKRGSLMEYLYLGTQIPIQKIYLYFFFQLQIVSSLLLIESLIKLLLFKLLHLGILAVGYCFFIFILSLILKGQGSRDQQKFLKDEGSESHGPNWVFISGTYFFLLQPLNLHSSYFCINVYNLQPFYKLNIGQIKQNAYKLIYQPSAIPILFNIFKYKMISLFKALFSLLLLTHVFSVNYKLVLLDQQRGAACLDGSPAGIYIHEGSGVNKTKYLIYFNGGGFCGGSSLSETLQSCYSRSKTNLGTTKVYKPQMSFDGNGALSTKSSENPTFYDWTKIFVIYCDGACHQGYRESPIQYKDQKLHFRGTRNVMELFRYLDITYNFYNGNSIVITGVSAGGMAVYQWSNYVYNNAKGAKVYSIPDSGFFITDYYSPIAQKKILAEKISNLFNLVSSQSTLQLPEPVQQCLKQPEYEDDLVACFDAGNYGKFLKAPTFIIQSPYDQWCLNYILAVKCLANSKAPYSLSRCNDTTAAFIEQYKQKAIEGVKQIKGARSDVGGWGPSCVQHGFISYPSFTSPLFKIPQSTGLTLNGAIDSFLRNPNNAPWLIEEIKWPNNKGCNGMTNIRSSLIE